MRKTLALLLLLVLPACNASGVQLRHVTAGGSGQATYRWMFEATTEIESPQNVSESTTSLDAWVSITRRLKDGTTYLTLNIDPIRLSQDGLATEDLRPIRLSYEIDQQGRARTTSAPGLIDGGGQLGSLTAIIGQEFQFLPSGGTEIGDSWDSPLTITAKEESMELAGRSTLRGFEVSGRRRSASVATSRSGKASTTQIIGRAKARLDGRIRQRTRSLLDVDRSLLVRSVTNSTASFVISLSDIEQGLVSVSQRSSLRLGDYPSS